MLNTLGRIVATAPAPLLWVVLDLKAGKIPALVDTGAQFSCVRLDVLEFLREKGENCNPVPCPLTCVLGDGKTALVSNAVRLRVGLLRFTWNYEFKILEESTCPIILGLDFLTHTQMSLDLCAMQYKFVFAPDMVGFLSPKLNQVQEDSIWLRTWTNWVDCPVMVQPDTQKLTREALMLEFPSLFSTSLGTAHCAPYDIELTDDTPVRSPPYRCAPPRLRVFRQLVDELLERGN